MSYTVRIERAAGKAFDRLPPATKQRIAVAIDALGENPRHSGVNKLTDSDNGYRVRVGRYRVVFTLDDPTATVSVVRIATRQEAYQP